MLRLHSLPLLFLFLVAHPVPSIFQFLLGNRSFERGGICDPNTIDTIQQSSKKIISMHVLADEQIVLNFVTWELVA